MCIMATVVCDAADPTTEAELTRTRRSRGQARQGWRRCGNRSRTATGLSSPAMHRGKLDSSRLGRNVLTAATAISLTGPSRHTDLGRSRYLSRVSVQLVTSWPRASGADKPSTPVPLSAPW